MPVGGERVDEDSWTTGARDGLEAGALARAQPRTEADLVLGNDPRLAG
jgi:hypothetical protein